MTLREAEIQIQKRWMMLPEEVRFLTCAGMYEAERTISDRLAPGHYTKRDRLEFVFFYMYGMTVEECVDQVPDRIP